MSKTFPYSYIRGKICKTKDALIPIQAKVVQYGLGVFSGVRGQWNNEKKQLYLFRLEDHYKRLKMSASITGMKFNFSYKQFADIIIKLAKKNAIKEDFYMRPMLYSASTKLTPRWDAGDDDLAIYMVSLKDYYANSNGLKVGVSSWRRLSDDAISLKAKISGTYANSAFAKTEAVANGYDEAIFLNQDGKVCEASSANIVGILDGVAITPPLASNNLNGITRKTLLEMLEDDLKITVKEQDIDRSMLYLFDELFLCGTAAKVTHIASVDGRKIGNGKEGKITAKISKLLDDALYGRSEKYLQHCLAIYEKN